RRRAKTSDPVPAGNVTTIVTGRVGQSSAAAGVIAAASAAPRTRLLRFDMAKIPKKPARSCQEVKRDDHAKKRLARGYWHRDQSAPSRATSRPRRTSKCRPSDRRFGKIVPDPSPWKTLPSRVHWLEPPLVPRSQ